MLLKILLAIILLEETCSGKNIMPLVDGCYLSYKAIYINKPGVKQRKEIILALHGLGASYSDWNSIEDDIVSNTGRKMYAPNFRNHADSCWTNASDIATMAWDIEGFMERHDIHNANVMGHSWGGKVAIHFALNYPHRVNSLIVEDMRPNGVTEAALRNTRVMIELMGEAFKQLPERLSEREAREFIVNYINNKLKEAGVNQRLGNSTANSLPIRCSGGKCEWTINYDVILDILQNPDKYFTQSNGRYGGPTLFIYGTESPVRVGDVKDEILDKFPKAQIIPIDGAQHVIHGLFPEFSVLVKNFLNDVP